MALAFSHLTAGFEGDEPVTTASISPTSGGVILVTISMTRNALDAVPPTDSITVSGLSGTWTKLATVTSGTSERIWFFQGTGFSGSGGITFNYTGPGTVLSVSWLVNQATGQDTTTPTSNTASADGTGGAITVSTSGTPDSGDATYSTAVDNNGSNWTPESGWTALGDSGDGVEGAYDATSPIDTSCTWTHGDPLGENAAFICIVNVASDSAENKSASDTQTVSITDTTSTLASSSTRTDNPTVGITETASISGTATASDTPTVGITDTATVSVAISATDTLTVSTTETANVAVVVSVSATDNISVGITDSGNVVVAAVSTPAKVRIRDTTTGDYREWVATGASVDTPAGGSVNVTIEQTAVGTAPPGAANTLTLNIYRDNGTLIRTYTLTPGSASQTVAFSFTDNGQSAGSARSGTVEIAIRATRTDAISYDVESDGSPNTPGTGAASILQRGWMRGTTSATQTLSNVSLGGSKASPAQYNESLFYRLTLVAPLYVARTFTVAISNTTPALSGTTNSSTTGPWDINFTSVVDERFPNSVSTASTTLTIPNATISGSPDVVLTTSSDSMSVDPRLPVGAKLWMMDDDVFGTPPMSKHEPSKSALVSSYSGLAFRLVTARTGEGVNGISTRMTFNPQNAGDNVIRDSVTATRGGEAGWTELNQLGPFVVGGTWNASLIATAPANIDAPGYISSNTEVVTILAQDPRIQLRGYVNLTTGHKGHFSEGDPIVINLTIRNMVSHIRIDPSRVTDVEVSVVRYRSSDHRLEYLSSAQVWTLWEPTGAVDVLAMTSSPNDPRNYILEIADTTGWNRDIMVEFACKVDGTPYPGVAIREETGKNNSHVAYAVDPVALALHGVISYR